MDGVEVTVGVEVIVGVAVGVPGVLALRPELRSVGGTGVGVGAGRTVILTPAEAVSRLPLSSTARD